jgi:HSP20 family protein
MKKRDVAEQMFSDILDAIHEKQDDLEKAIADYTSSVPAKPTMDIMETDEDIVVKTDLPGAKKEDIKIDITEDSLEITANFEEEEEDFNFIKRERRCGEVKRAVILPTKIIMEKASAKFIDGVLTVTLPKLEKNESFEIKVD